MTRTLVLISLALPLAACGIADTGAAAVSVAAAEAKEIRQGQKAEAQYREQLDAATKQAAEQRNAAEAAAQ